VTRVQRALHERRRTLWIVAALLILGGAVLLVYLQGRDDARRSDHRADQLAAEADLRGQAVGTLASDVRALRSQVKAAGRTPVAPDPTRAVANLPARTEVPVAIPGPAGPPGPAGSPGPSGAPGATGPSGVAGNTGTAGMPGAAGSAGPVGPAGPQGNAGPAGSTGPAGQDGRDGADGRPPAGWTFEYHGVTYTCSPVSNFDESSPRYQCTSDEKGPLPTVPAPQAGMLIACAGITRRRLNARENSAPYGRPAGPRPR
jgi:outer membrane murein-binding lipoprotein Lpp